MSGFGYGGLAVTALFATLMGAGIIGSSIDSAKYSPVEAEIFRIDRTCSFTLTSRATHRSTSETDGCSKTNEFDKMRDDHNRAKNVVGSADIQVSYVAPSDGSQQTGTLSLTGRDDEFYRWKAHDTIKILVDKTDPTKIRKF